MKEKIINFYKKNKLLIDILISSIVIFIIFLIFGIKIAILVLISFIIWRIGNKLDMFILNNITSLALLLIFSISFYTDIIIRNIQIFTTIGAIIVFWYGYKKYERDKEIELLIKYNDIRNKKIENFHLIFGNYSEVFYLKYNGYISDKLFNDIELIIDIEFQRLFSNDIKETNSKSDIIDSILKYGAVFEDGENKNIRNEFNMHLTKKIEKWINNENNRKFENKFIELQENNKHTDVKKKLLQLIANALKASSIN